ncbi:MAG: N-acetyl sugar amidotransferase [Pseudomonadota bacterium]
MISQQVCTRCIMDTTVPRITFDRDGVCNYCHLHDVLDARYPLNNMGEQRFHSLVNKMKNHGRGKTYDCICGFSGGRDSTYTLYLAKKLGLRPLAVYFNDGFGNPIAGENMQKAIAKLNVPMRTITADWRESKDLKIAALKASIPELNLATDIGIASALYGVATKERVRYIFIGQSFRTEGIAPLEWHYLDGKYLHAIHKEFGSAPLRRWRPTAPGFHLDLPQMAYYLLFKGIRTVMPLYHVRYVREEVDQLLLRELDWVNTGAHYFDDLFQALLSYVLRTKFNIDRRKFNYGALIRSGQMTREAALEKIGAIHVIEDEKIINLCIKRLGLSREEFDAMLAQPPKSFWDYPNLVVVLKRFRYLIKVLAEMHVVPGSAYEKYCNLW